ncbi:MAG TPA: hypothetical protein VFD30_02355 [Terriglobia bacterium]|nr:hypothetical protein [Terriglobia bacterium]
MNHKLIAVMVYGLTWLAIVGAVVLLAYVLWLRPWSLKWGATDAEVKGPLPGDELVPNPQSISTRAISIKAPAARVWPWLVQMGQGRGGFYSYDWLENIFGCDIHNADRIIPEFQNLKVGDGIRLHPKVPPLSVLIVAPNQALVIGAPQEAAELRMKGFPRVSWAFVLREVDSRNSRLIVRWRSAYPSGFLNSLANQYLLEPVHFTMERKTLLGIKVRAEQEVR